MRHTSSKGARSDVPASCTHRAILPALRLLLFATLSFPLAPSALPARSSSAPSGGLHLSPEIKEGLARRYAGDFDAAVALAHSARRAQPDHPAGYLLEADVLWWKMYCDASSVKWGMVDAWRRDPQPADDAYLALTSTAIRLAQARLRQSSSGEMHLYVGIALALEARLYALRYQKGLTAKTAVAAREQFLQAQQLDPSLADADTGLGLYNYFVDTLAPIIKMLRFFLGMPPGNKAEGIRQLQFAMAHGELTAVDARFYLAKNLRTYDHDYQRASAILNPLVLKYPRNPIFLLQQGNLESELGRDSQATAIFHAVQALPSSGSSCSARSRDIAAEFLAAHH